MNKTNFETVGGSVDSIGILYGINWIYAYS